MSYIALIDTELTIRCRAPSDASVMSELSWRRSNPLATVPEDGELNGEYLSLEEAGLSTGVVQQGHWNGSQVPELVEGQRLDPGHLRAVLGWEVTQDDNWEKCKCCIRTFKKHDKILVMPCWQRHVFHERCERYHAFRWVRERAKCPFCSTSVLEVDTRTTTDS